MTPPKMAWLADVYPVAASMSLVLGLQGAGLQIHPVSLLELDHTPAEGVEQDETIRTFYLRRTAASQRQGPHQRGFRRPRAYLQTLMAALKLGGTDVLQLKSAVRQFHEALVLREWLQSRGVSHVHVQGTGESAAVAALATRLGGVRMSMALEGEEAFRDETRSRLREKLAAASLITAPGYCLRTRACRLLPWSRSGQVEVCLPALDLGELPPGPELTHGVLCILSIGTLAGQRALLDAFALLRESVAAQLTLVGDGGERPAVEQAVADLGLAGSVTVSGLETVGPALYAANDVFVGSAYDGPTPALLEAMAMQLPCIAPYGNSVSDIISPEYDGLLVPPGDASSLLTALGRLAGDHDLRAQLGHNARLTLQQRCDVRQNTERLARLLESQIRL